jgi:hypothetical protein
MRTRSIASSPAGRAGFVAVTLTVLLAGCGSAETPAQPPAAAPAQPPAGVTGSPAAAPTAASPSPSVPAASDGTDLAACRDADCEVEVREGDRLRIDARFGVDSITVRSLGGDGATLRLEGSSGGMNVEGRNVSISGSCVNGRCHDDGFMSLTTSHPGRINDIRLRLAAVESSRAVLVLTAD